MKIKNFAFLSIFLFLNLTFQFNLHAEEVHALKQYIRHLDTIKFQDKDALIYLTDGMICKWKPEAFEKKMLTAWKKGDLIGIDTHSRKQGLVLNNYANDILYFPQIALTNQSIVNLPTIEKIVKTRDLNFTYLEIYDLFVSLSDGLCYTRGIYYDAEHDKFSTWKVGDRVIVDCADADFITLINHDLVNKPEYENAYDFLFELPGTEANTD